MPTPSSSLGTLLFTAGAFLPFMVVLVCFVIGLVKR